MSCLGWLVLCSTEETLLCLEDCEGVVRRGWGHASSAALHYVPTPFNEYWGPFVIGDPSLYGPYGTGTSPYNIGTVRICI